MPPDSDWLTLPEVAPELRRRGADRVPSYRETYNAVVDGIIPAQRGANGRWSICRSNLSIAAAALGVRLPPRPRSAASKRRSDLSAA